MTEIINHIVGQENLHKKSFKSLLQFYNEYIIDKEKSSYYNGGISARNFSELQFDDIKYYFSQGGKKELFDLLNNRKNNMENFYRDQNQGMLRIKHMFSVYLLGLILYDNCEIIKNNIKIFINQIRSINSNPIVNEEIEQYRKDFMYIWYLICLFHDIGMHAEKRSRKNIDRYKKIHDNIFQKSETQIIENENTFLFTEKLKEHCSYNGKKTWCECNDGCLNSECIATGTTCESRASETPFKYRTTGIPYEIMKNAYRYHQNRYENNVTINNHTELRCLDHGLFAAYHLSYSMRKLHKNNRKSLIAEFKGDFPIANLLQFSPKTYNTFILPAVWTILCHNIWLCNCEEGEKHDYYSKNNFTGLIDCNHKLINIQNHPFFFLFAYIDTIEICKRIPCKKENIDEEIDKILNSIYIIFPTTLEGLNINYDFAILIKNDQCKFTKKHFKEIHDKGKLKFLGDNVFTEEDSEDFSVFFTNFSSKIGK